MDKVPVTHATITFDPPLPCGSIDGDRVCGKPATAATADRWGPNQWIMLPLCKDCVAELAKNYNVAGSMEG